MLSSDYNFCTVPQNDKFPVCGRKYWRRVWLRYSLHIDYSRRFDLCLTFNLN